MMKVFHSYTHHLYSMLVYLAIADLIVLSFVPKYANQQGTKNLFYNRLLHLSNPKEVPLNEINTSITKLMDLASVHFTSQAVHTFVQLGVADMIGDENISVKELCTFIGPTTNEDALIRTLRLLVSAGILLHEERSGNDFFRLSNTGALLQTKVDGQPSMASGLMHWMEEPMWNAWSHLPDFIKGTPNGEENPDPFERSNGQSSDYYYNIENHPRSLNYANDFVRLISDLEIKSIAESLDWSQYAGKMILDIGGYNGKVLNAIASKYPNTAFKSMKSLDLPEVIKGIEVRPQHVELVAGNVLDISSVPNADVILLKHFLDRCMWDENDTIKILQTCREKIPADGQIVVAEAVISDFDQVQETNRPDIALDALYMLVGRERQRTESEWKVLALNSGCQIKEIVRTTSASCSLIILTVNEERN